MPRQRPMQLRRVILYQNGIGYFERTGHLTGGKLRLSFARPELDDVLKTLTVIDRLGASVATVDVPTPGEKERTIGIDVRMAAGRVHDLLVGYAVPTPTWKAAYRVVLDDRTPTALLQGWAMVNNASQEDWDGVQLTLATGAPMSYAHDLHTPEYVRRPDVTGRMVAPTVLGPVDAEVMVAVDHDADGILDVDDVCPDANEDPDGFEDVDGCPDTDNDQDRIADRDDRCPTEPESYNGHDDTDGCPDRGAIAIKSAAIEIMQRVMFQRDREVIDKASYAVLDAMAATLRDNPDLARVEIGGHASRDETEAWGLASRRAANVRQALIARGVSSDRLEINSYGATSALDGADTAAARARNRRVEFTIVRRGSEAPAQKPSRAAYAHRDTKLDTATMQASMQTRSKPADVAGSVRYVLGEPVSIKRGQSTMVSILNQQIRGEEAFLYRPDRNAPGSDRHPFRVARIENSSGFTLEPGPVAVFAGGTFVGDTLLARLQLGETAWIPFALDGGTTVDVARADDEQPIRLVSIDRGVMTVENAGTRTTRYTVAAGADPARTIYLRHGKSAGYTPRELPPGTQDQGDAYLIPLPITAGRKSVLTVEERQPRRAAIAILDANQTELGVYLEGTNIPAELTARIKTAIALRKDMGTLEDELRTLRTQVSDLASRAEELRTSIRALDRVRGADDLRKRLVASLTQVTADSDKLARTLGLKSEAVATARTQLQIVMRELRLEERPPA